MTSSSSGGGVAIVVVGVSVVIDVGTLEVSIDVLCVLAIEVPIGTQKFEILEVRFDD
jgi:hypothetical protein